MSLGTTFVLVLYFGGLIYGGLYSYFYGIFCYEMCIFNRTKLKSKRDLKVTFRISNVKASILIGKIIKN